MRFQVEICSENVQLDQIQNGRLSAIITFNMPDTGQTMPEFGISFVHFNFADPKNNMISTFLRTRHSVHSCINSRWRTKNINVHRRSKVSQYLNRVPSPLTAEGLCLFRNPKNIVLEQPRAKNGSLFRVKTVFFAREIHIKFK